ncbi:hypothetical protein POPTR_010G113800v4 [Populus trichocarpa]|uniref:Uncharacterized protein n=1 Tax=Populus trichocarpa TaxID=3694 RepID=A0ACC0SCU3_POPTR|nr:uncharacterized protein At1g66480 [Populus trichocarpa]KAI5573741.1 hypothetical protein BDE02_10G101000 [Populus trichocarpa]KAI9387042.1 hypothetical protein POPTR_010G113800v4 [Populus trichocarpa]
MGNSLGWKKTAKVMKISGETFKFKTPVKAGEVVKDYPGHVLLESEAVKHYGIRAKPLEAHQDLVPKRLYFLVELPKTPTEKVPRRVRSGINMSAKDRLESLMLSRRSTSDLSIMKPASIEAEEAKSGAMRVKMRLPKAEVEKLMQESKDETEAAAKIVDLCMANTAGGSNNSSREIAQNGQESALLQQQVHWKSAGHGRVSSQGIIKAREKRVSFLPVNEGETQIAVASY